MNNYNTASPKNKIKAFEAIKAAAVRLQRNDVSSSLSYAVLCIFFFSMTTFGRFAESVVSGYPTLLSPNLLANNSSSTFFSWTCIWEAVLWL